MIMNSFVASCMNTLPTWFVRMSCRYGVRICFNGSGGLCIAILGIVCLCRSCGSLLDLFGWLAHDYLVARVSQYLMVFIHVDHDSVTGREMGPAGLFKVILGIVQLLSQISHRRSSRLLFVSVNG